MRINTDELLRQASEFQPIVERMREIEHSIGQVDRMMNEQSIGEQFHPSFDAFIRNIACDIQDLNRLRLLLEQTVQLYEACERRITDEALQGTSNYPRHSVGVISLPQMGRPAMPSQLLAPLQTNLRSAPIHLEWIPWTPPRSGCPVVTAPQWRDILKPSGLGQYTQAGEQVTARWYSERGR